MTAKQIAGYLKAKKAPDGISFNDGYNRATYGITMDEYRVIDRAMHAAYGLMEHSKRTPAGVREALRLHGSAASRHHATKKKTPAQLQRDIDEALARSHSTKRGSKNIRRQETGLPVRDDVTELEYHRPPTASEIRFGEGATHYRTFPVGEAVFPGTRIPKKWLVASDDGLRYYR